MNDVVCFLVYLCLHAPTYTVYRSELDISVDLNVSSVSPLPPVFLSLSLAFVSISRLPLSAGTPSTRRFSTLQTALYPATTPTRRSRTSTTAAKEPRTSGLWMDPRATTPSCTQVKHKNPGHKWSIYLPRYDTSVVLPSGVRIQAEFSLRREPTRCAGRAKEERSEHRLTQIRRTPMKPPPSLVNSLPPTAQHHTHFRAVPASRVLQPVPRRR